MKVLATDFDLTLYLEDENIVMKNIKAINEFRSLGNILIIITGRQYTDMKPILKKYSITYDYLICEDGAIFYDKDNNLLNRVGISPEKISAIIKILKQNNYSYRFDNGLYYSNEIKDCIKVTTFYKDYKSASIVVDEIKKLNLNAYLSETSINITEQNANKLDALHYMKEFLNINNKDLYTIGDNINDLEMLKEYNGVIMRNHHDSLKKLNLKEYDTFYQYIEELVND